MSAADHDRAVALTSHVPQLLASVLTVLAARRGAFGAAGPAFASATRVAGGAANMWKDIFETNADEIADALRELSAALTTVADGLQSVEPARAALELLTDAREQRSRRGGT
jgi:prephenate dehydrogenase